MKKTKKRIRKNLESAEQREEKLRGEIVDHQPFPTKDKPRTKPRGKVVFHDVTQNGAGFEIIGVSRPPKG